MRNSYPGRRALLVTTLLAALLAGCAQGGLADEDIDPITADDEDSRKDGSKGSKDAAQDSATSSDEDGDSAGSKDAGAAKDSGRSVSGDAGGSALPTIKCPTNMICTADLSLIIATMDPQVKADTTLCAQSGFLPMLMSCKTDDECKSARLTSGKCSRNYCIQACTK